MWYNTADYSESWVFIMNAVLIPAYKPDMKLVELCGKLVSDRNLKIVVVDDGSGAEYKGVFEALPEGVKLISYPVNKGKGGALKTGIKEIYENMPECACIVTADADGQHKYEDILRVLEVSEKDANALVMGCRVFTGSNVPFRSRFGNNVTKCMFKLCSGVYVSDTQTGLRAFGREGMKAFMEVEGTRYEYEINMLMRAAKGGMPIKEVPIETVYIDENKSSHFNPVKDAAKIYKCMFKSAFTMKRSK